MDKEAHPSRPDLPLSTHAHAHSLLHSIDPRKIENPTLRSLLETAVDFGDAVVAKSAKLVKTVKEAK